MVYKGNALKEFEKILDVLSKKIVECNKMQKDLTSNAHRVYNLIEEFTDKIPSGIGRFKNEKESLDSIFCELTAVKGNADDIYIKSKDIIQKQEKIISDANVFASNNQKKLKTMFQMYKEGKLDLNKENAKRMNLILMRFKEKISDISKISKQKDMDKAINKHVKIPDFAQQFIKPLFLQRKQENIYLPKELKDFMRLKQKVNLMLFDNSSNKLKEAFNNSFDELKENYEKVSSKFNKEQVPDEVKLNKDFVELKKEHDVFCNSINRRTKDIYKAFLKTEKIYGDLTKNYNLAIRNKQKVYLYPRSYARVKWLSKKLMFTDLRSSLDESLKGSRYKEVKSKDHSIIKKNYKILLNEVKNLKESIIKKYAEQKDAIKTIKLNYKVANKLRDEVLESKKQKVLDNHKQKSDKSRLTV